MKKEKLAKNLIYLLLLIILAESIVYFAKILVPIHSNFQQTGTLTTIKKPVTKQQFNYKLPILVYHYVEHVKDPKDTIRKSLNITPETFELQIKTLQGSGYQFITPGDISKIENGQMILAGKPIMITFDDGYRDFYTDVFPILKKYQIRVVAYIVPGFLDKLNYMFWQDLKEVSQSGLVEIGAHTLHHVVLTRLDEKTAFEEILQSKQVLEQQLGIKVTTFAYPYGSFDDQVINLVNQSGLSTAMTEKTGVNDNLDQPLVLKRIHPGGNVGNALLFKL